MAAKDRAAKDKAMAAHLKKHNVKRTTTQCPFHYGPVNLNSLVGHIQTCKAGLGRRVYSR